jgi:hypothetical protein
LTVWWMLLVQLQRRRQRKIIRMMRNSEGNLMLSCCSSVSTFLFSICLIVAGTYFFIKYFIMDNLGVERQWHSGTLQLYICLSLLWLYTCRDHKCYYTVSLFTCTLSVNLHLKDCVSI